MGNVAPPSSVRDGGIHMAVHDEGHYRCPCPTYQVVVHAVFAERIVAQLIKVDPLRR